MFASLKDLFNAITGPLAGGASTTAGTEHGVQLAAAVLLIEVMRSDAEYSPAERSTVVQTLRDKFTLGDDEIARLLELAEATSREAPDLYTFTSRLNKGFSTEQKLRMVEYLWQVAYADGTLSHHENHLMRKLGDLLYIPRGDFVAAKQHGRAAAGIAEPDSAAE
ncbi:TerB family tellurite resistance protein [Aromatoleum toluclasticum]|uniref:tellurite resistance TerB family protein n=1 Tax=Aromatoleum toluclasticum TaxID=92003 RepID=UPI001D18E4D9|nr:TerB family tellurite resistance protein [Aromatoleum toluclasticum]MCC4116541.1 TerB family tellurite resistance protein [Aromatoleum toluclasticum]